MSEGQKIATPRTRAYHHPDAVVAIEDRSVEHHHRIEPGKWVVRTDLREGALELESIGISLTIADLWLDLDRLGR